MRAGFWGGRGGMLEGVCVCVQGFGGRGGVCLKVCVCACRVLGGEGGYA